VCCYSKISDYGLAVDRGYQCGQGERRAKVANVRGAFGKELFPSQPCSAICGASGLHHQCFAAHRSWVLMHLVDFSRL
jgi:hypothetical protein